MTNVRTLTTEYERSDLDNPEKKDLYWQTRLREVEQRLYRVEAELRALQERPSNNSDFYTLQEAATALGVDKQTVRRWWRKGKLNAYKEGRVVRIPKSEIRKIFE